MMMFVYQVTVRQDGVWLSWRWLKSCLMMGSDEQIPCFALPVCAGFPLPIKLSLCPCRSFLTFTILIFSSALVRGGE